MSDAGATRSYKRHELIVNKELLAKSSEVLFPNICILAFPGKQREEQEVLKTYTIEPIYVSYA